MKEGSTKPKVTFSFELSRSHLFRLKSASAVIDEKVIEEVVVEKKKPEEKEEANNEENSEEQNSEASGEQKEEA